MKSELKKSELEGIIATLAAAYPAARFEAATVALYERMLADIPAAALDRAIQECIATCRYLPTIAEIRERVADRHVGAPDPLLAWQIVVEAASVYGREREPAWGHPAIGAAVRAIGWVHICACSEDYLAPLRREWTAAYARLVHHDQQDAQVSRGEIGGRERGMLEGIAGVRTPAGARGEGGGCLVKMCTCMRKSEGAHVQRSCW